MAKLLTVYEGYTNSLSTLGSFHSQAFTPAGHTPIAAQGDNHGELHLARGDNKKGK